MRRLLAKLGLAVFTTLLVFGACELVARAFFPAPSEPYRQPQVLYQYDPDVGYTHVPNQTGWIDAGIVTINSQGFRGAEVALPKPPGRVRIVVIGDSLTLGMGVGEDETFCAQLQQMLRAANPRRDIDVINLGVSGYNTRQEVALLKRHAASLQPDLVLVGFYINDVSGATDASTSGGGATIAAVQPTPGQILRMNPPPSSRWRTWMRRSRVGYLLGRALTRVMGAGEWSTKQYALDLDLLEGRSSPMLDESWGRVAESLRDLKALADSGPFAVGIVILPNQLQVTGQYPNAQYQQRLRAIAEPLGMLVVDALPAFAKHTRSEGLFIPYDIHHPSATGHRIIAGAIAEALEREPRLVPGQ